MVIAKRALSSLLTSPSKVAQALDWKKASGSILSVSVNGANIDIAVASHPVSDDEVTSLASIPLKTEIKDGSRVLSPKVVGELSKIVHDFSVCGLIVSWPVQEEGWCGAPCGKVLFTLDQLMAQSKTLLSKSRPICLWDTAHHQPVEDEWGRAEIYAEPSDKAEHRASQEQYLAPKTLAADVWNDFCRAHWPELYYQSHSADGEVLSATPPSTVVDAAWLDSYEDTSSYIRAAL
jgi:hypothetical protein